MARELHVKVNYCSECPAFHEDYDHFGVCAIAHFGITPSDHLDESGHMGFPEKCPLKVVTGGADDD